MKRQRPHLVSDATVQAMRAKYGRPDVSGRKRKKLESETVVDPPNAKVPRFKVHMNNITFICVIKNNCVINSRVV